MKFRVPLHMIAYVHGGKTLPPSTFVESLKASFPDFSRLIFVLADALRRGESVCDHAFTSMLSNVYIETLYVMASTGIRREIYERLNLHVTMTGVITLAVTRGFSSISVTDACTPADRVGDLQTRYPGGFEIITRLANRIRHEYETFSLDAPAHIPENVLLELMTLHAVTPFREALEAHFGIELAFQHPYSTAAQAKGADTDRFKNFRTVEAQILNDA